ncbi:ribosome hibernation-promoting factor, HPF/YfiA family [Planctomicrobium sp. SH668]|uniref:ribosome hibernation-promoting factor, HPF/YfiA family n=1 Tax=Planctomicrobium sp. SH668 TaxID=3448126 RepID=UPI003F5AF0E8
MQVEITCRHGSIGPDFHEYITRKCSKLLNILERVTSIRVTISYEGDRAEVEILVDAEHKHDFVTSHVDLAPVVNATFEAALAKMEQQIRKYKEKVQDHRRDKPLNEIAGDPTKIAENAVE